MRAFLLDDEPLALKRLARMLAATGRVDVVGKATDPAEAISAILKMKPDVLFLDIEMPGMNGFETLSQLGPQPLVVFTTAYGQYALDAFGFNSVDYLLKPIEAAHLNRALDKIERMQRGAEPRPPIHELLERLTALKQYPDRIASRTGDRVEFIPLQHISHFYASDKLTYAATGAKNYVLDHTIQELERKLDPRKFVRIHRAALLNLDYVLDLNSWIAGRMMVRLNDAKRTALPVSRDRVRVLKERLGI